MCWLMRPPFASLFASSGLLLNLKKKVNSVGLILINVKFDVLQLTGRIFKWIVFVKGAAYDEYGVTFGH